MFTDTHPDVIDEGDQPVHEESQYFSEVADDNSGFHMQAEAERTFTDGQVVLEQIDRVAQPDSRRAGSPEVTAKSGQLAMDAGTVEVTEGGKRTDLSRLAGANSKPAETNEQKPEAGGFGGGEGKDGGDGMRAADHSEDDDGPPRMKLPKHTQLTETKSPSGRRLQYDGATEVGNGRRIFEQVVVNPDRLRRGTDELGVTVSGRAVFSGPEEADIRTCFGPADVKFTVRFPANARAEAAQMVGNDARVDRTIFYNAAPGVAGEMSKGARQALERLLDPSKVEYAYTDSPDLTIPRDFSRDPKTAQGSSTELYSGTKLLPDGSVFVIDTKVLPYDTKAGVDIRQSVSDGYLYATDGSKRLTYQMETLQQIGAEYSAAEYVESFTYKQNTEIIARQAALAAMHGLEALLPEDARQSMHVDETNIPNSECSIHPHASRLLSDVLPANTPIEISNRIYGLSQHDAEQLLQTMLDIFCRENTDKTSSASGDTANVIRANQIADTVKKYSDGLTLPQIRAIYYRHLGAPPDLREHVTAIQSWLKQAAAADGDPYGVLRTMHARLGLVEAPETRRDDKMDPARAESTEAVKKIHPQAMDFLLMAFKHEDYLMEIHGRSIKDLTLDQGEEVAKQIIVAHQAAYQSRVPRDKERAEKHWQVVVAWIEGKPAQAIEDKYNADPLLVQTYMSSILRFFKDERYSGYLDDVRNTLRQMLGYVKSY